MRIKTRFLRTYELFYFWTGTLPEQRATEDHGFPSLAPFHLPQTGPLKPQGENYLSDSYGSGRRGLVEMQDEVDLSKWYTGPKMKTKISGQVQSRESIENISLSPWDWNELDNKKCYSSYTK